MLGENGRCWRAAISQMGFLVEANIVLADSLIPGFKWIKVAGLSVGDKIIVPRGLMSWIGQYHHKVNQNDTKENNIEKDIAVHNNNLSFLTSSSSLANIQNNINIKNDSVKFFIGSDVIIDE